MKIGQVSILGKAALAPMAGVADRAFRRLCVENGASYVVSEMVSCKGLCFADEKSGELLRLDEQEHPAAVQLFGDDPDKMARAAELAMAYHPDVIDINMGCPAPKIAGNGCGSALMRRPELCREIVAAVCSAVPVPVTAKIRKGYSREEVNAVEVALACESGGAAAVTVHGRTRDQMYGPPVDWDIIRQVKRAVQIPVIGNGDVDSPQAAAAMYEQTGCDLVMVGRGALGAPWLFARIEAYLNQGTLLPDPPFSRRMSLLLRQAEMAVAFKGERVAMREMRKHAAWYVRGLRGAAALRAAAGQLTAWEDLTAFCTQVIAAAEAAGGER
ncbi:MAG: tRNA dihydrouridine synthase DusB [Clostridiales bacterium]|jgi:tRNA-dihydrouridine synthase B|nr:tRNA dihydrouridine synthase DusB [Clostridiales bacterium]